MKITLDMVDAGIRKLEACGYECNNAFFTNSDVVLHIYIAMHAVALAEQKANETSNAVRS